MELREDISTKPALLLSGQPFNSKSDEEFCPPSMEYPQEVLVNAFWGPTWRKFIWEGSILWTYKTTKPCTWPHFPPFGPPAPLPQIQDCMQTESEVTGSTQTLLGFMFLVKSTIPNLPCFFHPSFEGRNPPSSLQWYESFQDGVWRWASVQIYMLDLHMI